MKTYRDENGRAQYVKDWHYYAKNIGMCIILFPILHTLRFVFGVQTIFLYVRSLIKGEAAVQQRKPVVKRAFSIVFWVLYASLAASVINVASIWLVIIGIGLEVDAFKVAGVLSAAFGSMEFGAVVSKKLLNGRADVLIGFELVSLSTTLFWSHTGIVPVERIAGSVLIYILLIVLSFLGKTIFNAFFGRGRWEKPILQSTGV